MSNTVNPLVELRGVYRNFKSGKETIHALSETSLKIYPGDFIAIIGPSGSGKSTLLTIMGGLQSPSGGEVLLNSKRFSSASKKERVSQRMRNIGFILQTSNLIPFLTIEDQFRFVDRVLGRDFQAKKMENLLKRLRIYDLIKQYPSDLSGGELQRAAIARALYPGPSLVLADEPTASLDTEKAFDLVKMLSEETKSLKKATVMVTHDERLIQYCDRIYQIEDGILRDVTKQKKTSK